MKRLHLIAIALVTAVGAATAIGLASSSCLAARVASRSEPRVAEAGAAGRGEVGPHGRDGEVLRLDFERMPVGPLSEKLLREEGLRTDSVSSHVPERAHVNREGDGNHVLRVDYPAGGVGPAQSGAVFIVTVPPADEYYLSYRVRLDADFDFARGGKLPGLSSGGGKYSGGRIPLEGDGWSARLVWGRTADASVYLYHVGMPGPWGEMLHLNTAFQPGRWHVIVQRIRLNHGDQSDGIVEVWLDGVLRLERRDLKLRLGGKGLADSLCFSTFHGGNAPEFAPQRDGHASFDDFVISSAAPPHLSQPAADAGASTSGQPPRP